MSVVPIKNLLNKQHLLKSVNTTQSPATHFGIGQTKDTQKTILSKQDLSMLWMKLTAIYGQLFISMHGINDNGVWFKTLNDLTPRALESGLERLMSLSYGKQFCEFPPNALQFRALCLGFYENLRLPTPFDAYQEIKSHAYLTSQNWSHPAVRFTAKKMGLNFLNEKDDAKTFSLFKKAYEQVCHLIKQGLEVPEVSEPLMPPKVSNKIVALEHLGKIRQMLGVLR